MPYNEAKYANYCADELQMEFYLQMMRDVDEERGLHLQRLWGSKPVYDVMVSNII
jgi:hypothetical protein